MPNGEIRVYLIARISEDAHPWNRMVCDKLKSPIEVFMPQDHNPWNERHELFGKEVYDVDIEAMRKSHMGLLLPEFGKDSAFEVGWYANSKRPVVAFVDAQMAWLIDWMVKGGVDYVVTNNPKTYRVLKKDPILKHKKIILIEKIDELNKVIKKVYDDTYAKKLPAKP